MATFARWHDRIGVVVLLVFTVAALRYGLLGQSHRVAFLATMGGSALIGIACARAIHDRLAFHAADGPLAAHALSAGPMWRYRSAWHLVAMTPLVVVAIITDPRLLAAALIGYSGATLFGGSIGLITARAGYVHRWTGNGLRRVSLWLQRPLAGFCCGTLFMTMLAIFSFLRTMSPDAMVVLSGIGAALCVVVLSMVDHTAIRFMAMAGYGPWRSVCHRSRSLMSFLPIAVPLTAVMLGRSASAIVAAIGVAGLIILTLRILTYRIHAKRMADLLLTILIGISVLIGVSMPVLLPILLATIIRQFQRRARSATWAIA